MNINEDKNEVQLIDHVGMVMLNDVIMLENLDVYWAPNDPINKSSMKKLKYITKKSPALNIYCMEFKIKII